MTTPKRFSYPSPLYTKYWNTLGQSLLGKIELPKQEDSLEKLYLLNIVDDLADEVVKDTYQKLGYKEADRLITIALEQGIKNVDNAPESLIKLFAEVDKIPNWLDKKLINHGTDFCNRSADLGLIVLRNYSLMSGYRSTPINKPLIFTGALKKGAAKRLEETTEFWINITGKNALDRHQIGFKSIIKIRLLHSYSRLMILEKADWDSHDWGLPLNLWDMQATNLGFSLIFLDGLRKLNFNPSQEEIDGLFHFWKYVGFLLGIDPKLLADTEQQAITLLYQWSICQLDADEETKTLAIALMDEPLLARYPEKAWQRKLMKEIHLSYNNYFLGMDDCHFLGLRKSRFNAALFSRISNYFLEKRANSNPNFYEKMRLKGRKKQEFIRDYIQGKIKS